MMERNHRTEQNSAIDHIRKLRKFSNDLQAQLETAIRNLQVTRDLFRNVDKCYIIKLICHTDITFVRVRRIHSYN